MPGTSYDGGTDAGNADTVEPEVAAERLRQQQIVMEYTKIVLEGAAASPASATATATPDAIPLTEASLRAMIQHSSMRPAREHTTGDATEEPFSRASSGDQPKEREGPSSDAQRSDDESDIDFVTKIRQKDLTPEDLLMVMEITRERQSFFRSEMSMFRLLKAARPPRDLRKTPARRHRSDFFRELDAEVDLNSSSQRSLATTALPAPAYSLAAPVHLRDLRTLVGVSEPAILVRRGAFVVSLDPIRAIVTSRSAYVVVPPGADEMLSPLLSKLTHAFPDAQQAALPFELAAFEAMLTSVLEQSVQTLSRIAKHATEVIAAVKQAVQPKVISELYQLRREVDEVLDMVQRLERALDDVQQDDPTMARMYLTALEEGEAQARLDMGEYRTEEVEGLLDAFALEIDAIRTQAAFLAEQLQASTVQLDFRLQTKRNVLILIDMRFGLAMMWISMAVCVASMIGMNLYPGMRAVSPEPKTLRNVANWEWLQITLGTTLGMLVGLGLMNAGLYWSGWFA